MQNMEVHIQVLNKTWFNKHSKIRFEFEIHFNQDTLMQNTVVAIVTLGVSQHG
jgi:hypothetical protein